MLQFFKRALTFIELIIGIFLPWKLRCQYSEFLLRLETHIPINFPPQPVEGKERNFLKYLYLGYYYMKKDNFEKAIENLNLALESDPNNYRVANIYRLLSICYKRRGELDRSIESIVNSYKVNKKRKGKT